MSSVANLFEGHKKEYLRDEFALQALCFCSSRPLVLVHEPCSILPHYTSNHFKPRPRSTAGCDRGQRHEQFLRYGTLQLCMLVDDTFALSRFIETILPPLHRTMSSLGCLVLQVHGRYLRIIINNIGSADSMPCWACSSLII